MTNSTQRAHLNVGCIAQLSLPLRETATDDKFYTASSPKCWRYCTTLSERQLQMTNSTQRAHLNVGGIARSFRGLSVESQVGQLASSVGSKLHVETHAAP